MAGANFVRLMIADAALLARIVPMRWARVQQKAAVPVSGTEPTTSPRDLKLGVRP
jgi:hypothetical protein